MSLATDEGRWIYGSRAVRASDPEELHRVIVGIGKWWSGGVAKREQREVRASEHVEEPNGLPAFSRGTGRIGCAISSADARRAIQIARQRAAPVGEAQLGGVGEGLFAREQIGDPLALAGKGLPEFPVANGCRSQNALSDG